YLNIKPFVLAKASPKKKHSEQDLWVDASNKCGKAAQKEIIKLNWGKNPEREHLWMSMKITRRFVLRYLRFTKVSTPQGIIEFKQPEAKAEVAATKDEAELQMTFDAGIVILFYIITWDCRMKINLFLLVDSLCTHPSCAAAFQGILHALEQLIWSIVGGLCIRLEFVILE
ncbi:hypothetical protein ACJX0J_025151, partial [Zea mays]